MAATKDTVVKALQDAGVVVEVKVAKEAEPDKKDKKEEKPKPSGIKPRQFLLLTLALCIMTIPVVALVLPVFLSARKQRESDDSGSVQLCVTPVPLVVATANATNITYPHPHNATYLAQVDAACRQLWANATAAEQSGYTPPDLLGYVSMLLTLSTIDPLNLFATVNVNVDLGGNITNARGTLDVSGISKNATLNLDLLNTAGFDVALKQGDRSTQKTPRYTLRSVKSLFNYPFDKYSFKFGVFGRLENPGNKTQFQMLPVGINFQTGYVGWKVTIQRSNDPWDQMIYPDADSLADRYYQWLEQNYDTNNTLSIVNIDSGVNTSSELEFTVILERSSFVKFFSIMILTGMWLITSFLIGYGIDACYLRPRAVTMGDSALFTGLLFALPGIRNAMPAVPPIGVAVDMFGFIWLMMFLMMTAVQVSSRHVMLYVHPEPTLYDKVFKTAAYHDWVKKKKEEEEKKKREEEEKATKEKLGL